MSSEAEATEARIVESMERVHELRDQLNAAIDARDDLVREALNQGIGPTRLAQVTGMQRSQVYMIRDAK